MKLFKIIVVTAVILLLLVFGIKQQLDINSLNDEISQLESQLSQIRYENEKKQNELDMSIEESMEKQAKEEGYKDPDARYFYNDFAG